jgi:hypothetical protein
VSGCPRRWAKHTTAKNTKQQKTQQKQRNTIYSVAFGILMLLMRQEKLSDRFDQKKPGNGRVVRG